MYEKVKRWHRQGLWTVKMVDDAVTKGAITQGQAEEIKAEVKQNA